MHLVVRSQHRFGFNIWMDLVSKFDGANQIVGIFVKDCILSA